MPRNVGARVKTLTIKIEETETCGFCKGEGVIMTKDHGDGRQSGRTCWKCAGAKRTTKLRRVSVAEFKKMLELA